MNLRKLALLVSLVSTSFGFTEVSQAQRVIVTGENAALDGTYNNIASDNFMGTTPGFSSTRFALWTNGIMRLSGTSGWTAALTAAQATTATSSAAILAVQPMAAYSSALNITTATQVKSTLGQTFMLSVVVPGAAGQLCDVNGACAAANVVATIPAVVGVYTINWHHAAGIRVEPGAGQTLAISYQ